MDVWHWLETHDVCIYEEIVLCVERLAGSTQPRFSGKVNIPEIVYGNLKEAYYDEATSAWSLTDYKIETEVLKVLEYYNAQENKSN